MKMKNALLAMLASFVFAAAAIAAPSSVPTTAVAPTAAIADAPEAGVYDTEAGICIEAAYAAEDIDNAAQEVRCWKCRKDSKGSCGGGDMHCYGERSECSKKGCKITGSTSKCSGSKKTC